LDCSEDNSNNNVIPLVGLPCGVRVPAVDSLTILNVLVLFGIDMSPALKGSVGGYGVGWV
jgi:hypothetical protein